MVRGCRFCSDLCVGFLRPRRNNFLYKDAVENKGNLSTDESQLLAQSIEISTSNGQTILT